jgi:hypothetical protein
MPRDYKLPEAADQSVRFALGEALHYHGRYLAHCGASFFFLHRMPG